MALSLSEILLARLEQLGGKTGYWLAEQIDYDPKNIDKVIRGKRALPDEYVPRLLRVLGITEDSAEAQELRDAIGLARMKLKEDVKPTLESMQRTLLRLTQQLDRANRVVEQQRGQLAILREQRETSSSKIRELQAQVVELSKVVTRLEELDAQRRTERSKR